MWTPPFNLELSEIEQFCLMSLIPTEPNNERIGDIGYHQSKIEFTLEFAPLLSRVEAWALSMYLGPTYYYRNINLSLANVLPAREDRDKFLLIAKAATIALVKIPAITLTELQTLPQPTSTKYQYLKRYKKLSVERINKYQPGRKITETTFTSTTYWQDVVGLMQRYSEQATAVFHINPNSISQGRYVDPIKRRNREGEILFPPNIRFQVSKIESQEYQVTESGQTRELMVIELNEL
ncbi:ADP-ribosyltransferase [Nodularia chucula]|uniref:ADP-ribosyltransferase n=1 Tax=Nodularia chucula TaxID=3093667 RepID=UPI0039C653EB